MFYIVSRNFWKSRKKSGFFQIFHNFFRNFFGFKILDPPSVQKSRKIDLVEKTKICYPVHDTLEFVSIELKYWFECWFKYSINIRFRIH